MKSIGTIQREQAEWALRNFGERNVEDPFLGVVEEVGELSHAVLKRRQGIRGTTESHDAAARDAVGDIAIYLLDYCTATGVDMSLAHSEACEWPSRSDDDYTAILRLAVVVGEHAKRVLDNGRGAERFYDVCAMIARLRDFCRAHAWSFEEILNETWVTVGARDWKAYPESGFPDCRIGGDSGEVLS